MNKALTATSPAPPAPPPAPHVQPGPVEQEHIKQALEASETAIDAIGTIVSVSTWALGIIAVALTLIAVWGYAAIRRAASEEAKQIANKRFDDYIETDEFKEMVKARIAQSVHDRWGSTFVVSRISEEQKDPNDPSPFPSGDRK